MKTPIPPSVKALTIDQAKAMGYLPDNPVPPAQAWWNRLRFRFVAWITRGRIELQFKKPELEPLKDLDALPGEEAVGPAPHALDVSVRYPVRGWTDFQSVPEPAPEADIKPLLAVALKYQPKTKRTRPKSTRPTKRGGSPRSRFRK